MTYIIKIAGLGVVAVICLTLATGCATYREPGIVESDAATVKGHIHAMIQIGDGKKSLAERGRDHQAYHEVLVAPGHICIAVDISPQVLPIPPYEYRTCPICFDVKAANTYHIDTRWETRWPELRTPLYVRIVEESTGRVVAEQSEFCRRDFINIHFNPALIPD
jgi:hypothetical protein